MGSSSPVVKLEFIAKILNALIVGLVTSYKDKVVSKGNNRDGGNDAGVNALENF